MKCLALLTVLMPIAISAMGGRQRIHMEPDDPVVVFAMSAMNEFMAQRGDNQARTLVRVRDATSQAVTGTLYTLDLIVDAGRLEETCIVKVWTRPWLSGDQAMQLSGDPTCKKAAVVAKRYDDGQYTIGPEETIDGNYIFAQHALTFAVETYNSKTDSLFYEKSVGVTKVTSQTAGGVIYRFYGVQLSDTTCSKNDQPPADLKACPLASNPQTTSCDFTVLDKPWERPEYTFVKMQCQ